MWLDRLDVLKTLRERERSEAYRVLAASPPKVILWSYRIDAIYPVVAPLIRDSYLSIGPKLRIAGLLLRRGQRTTFDVPVVGRYALYTPNGYSVMGEVELDGVIMKPPFRLDKGHSGWPCGPARAWH